MILGIDASNIGSGGTKNHLSEILKVVDPAEYGFEQVIVWGGRRSLDILPQRKWLTLVHQPILDKSLPYRTWWQLKHLPGLAERSCDLLFVPGGQYTGKFRPFVTMSRNMLPFEPQQMRQFGISTGRLKMLLLRNSQSRTFSRADGLIFLSHYAQQRISTQIKPICGQVRVIPHGIHERFRLRPRPQNQTEFRFLYLSSIHVYKHQWHVASAVARLRAEGWPIHVDFAGTPYREAMPRFLKTLNALDPGQEFLRYIGDVPASEIHHLYHHADVFVFASTCENLPNILLEAMAAGLPIACSNRQPMPEILRDAGVYFDPEYPAQIANALRCLMESPTARAEYANRAYTYAHDYSWERCAAETFRFLQLIAAG